MALRTVLPGGHEREARLLAKGARVLAPEDAEFPRLLREIPRPPRRLWLRGLPLGTRPAVAVVGARRASRAGLAAARHLAAGLAKAGVVVVSGFARGIDAAAHRAALETGGTTVAVFGCGLDVCYPAEHAALLEDLVAGGTAISEFDPGERPLPYYFPVRNRLIAGLSRLVLVVEAAEKSGSLITARYAADFGRDVAAVPGPILTDGCAGSNALLKDGAILVRDVEDVLAELEEPALVRPATRTGLRAPVPPPDLDPDAAAVLAALDAEEPRDADALVAATSLSASRLSSALVRLELEGLATALPGGLFVRLS
ncbi:MAG TPA: DNA-processing protein DprA [Thermoanaerobaculia bacterium]|nr:DNA-processing protein DprA [Thermoanaerobaculia bacterium]